MPKIIFLHLLSLCVLDWRLRWVDRVASVDANVKIFDWLLCDLCDPPLFDDLSSEESNGFTSNNSFFAWNWLRGPQRVAEQKGHPANQSKSLTLASTGATRLVQRCCQSRTQDKIKWRNKILGKFWAKTNKSVSGKVKNISCQNYVKQTLRHYLCIARALPPNWFGCNHCHPPLCAILAR